MASESAVHVCDSNKFKQAIGYDLAATAAEMIGATLYKSIVLSGNSGIGVLDALMLLLNYFGCKLEAKAGKRKVGLTIAACSDVLFAIAYLMAAVFGAFYLVEDANEPIKGQAVLILACISLSFTILSATSCPKNNVNGDSARFKMWLSVGVGGAAIINGYLVYHFGYRWIEKITTCAAGTGVLIAAVIRLRHLWASEQIGLLKLTPRSR